MDRIRGAAIASSQDDFDRISRIALATFNAQRANGRSVVEAIDAIGDAIDGLDASYQAFGFTSSTAFEQLSRWRGLASANRPLLESVAGLNDLMMALANLGSLDADTFRDMQAQGLDAFAQLQAAGFTQQESLAQMAPALQTIIDLHNSRGLAIDEETQKLIDQAREQGLLKDEQISTNDVLMQGFRAIIEALHGEVPDAFRTMAERAKDEFKKVKGDAEQTARDMRDAFDRVQFPKFDASGGPPAEAPPSFATGAFVRRPTLAMVGDAPGGEFVTPMATIRQWLDQAAVGGALAAGMGRPQLLSVTINMDNSGALFTDPAAIRPLARALNQEFIDVLRRNGVVIYPVP